MDKKTENTAAVVALVCGILSIVLCWIPYVYLCCFPLGIVGIVFGVKVRKIEEKKGMATAGLVCGIIGLSLACIFLVCAICIVSTATTATNTFINSLNY